MRLWAKKIEEDGDTAPIKIAAMACNYTVFEITDGGVLGGSELTRPSSSYMDSWPEPRKSLERERRQAWETRIWTAIRKALAKEGRSVDMSRLKGIRGELERAIQLIDVLLDPERAQV